MAKAKPKGRFFSRAWSGDYIRPTIATEPSDDFASSEVNAPGFRAVLVVQSGKWAMSGQDPCLKLFMIWDEDTENSRQAEITIPLPRSKADLIPLFAELVKDQLEEPEE